MKVNKIKKTKMTAAENKEAIRRDKEWMDNIDPEEEIVIPKGALNVTRAAAALGISRTTLRKWM